MHGRCKSRKECAMHAPASCTREARKGFRGTLLKTLKTFQVSSPGGRKRGGCKLARDVRPGSSSSLTGMGLEDIEPVLCAFDFDNFHVWRLRTEAALALHELLGLVTGTEAKPKPPAKLKPSAYAVKKQMQYEKQDSKARALILQTVQDMHLYIVRGSKTAKEAWDSLCQAYQRWAHKNWFALQHRLYELHLVEGDCMHSHIQTFDTYVQHVSVKGEMDELTKAVILLRSVPHSYNIWVERQAREDNKPKTLAYVVDNLLHFAEEEDRERNKIATPAGSPGVGAKKTCFYCDSPSHLEKKCWRKVEDERNRA